MNNYQKRMAKMIYLHKIPYGTPADVERFFKIFKNQKNINANMNLFKKHPLELFINNKSMFNDICFLRQYVKL